MILLKLPKIGSLKKSISVLSFTYLEEYFKDREAKVSKFKFMHALSESKSLFAIEQKAVVSCFVKNVAFLLRHPVDEM